MRAPRLLLPLSLLAAVAAGALVFAGVRLSADEDARGQADMERATRDGLGAQATALGALFADRVPDLLTLTDSLPMDGDRPASGLAPYGPSRGASGALADRPASGLAPYGPSRGASGALADMLRDLLRHGIWYRSALVADDRGRLLFPPSPRSTQETDFLERTRSLWAGGVAAAPPAEVSPPEPAAALRSWRWRTWFWGPGLQVGFERRLPDGRIVVIELDRARLLADVMERLPADGGTPGHNGPHTALVDESGATLYAYGEAAGNTPTLDMPLPAPLSTWHLSQSLPPPTGDTRRLGLWVGIGSAIVLLLLAVRHIARESTRAMREALQRVTFVNQVSHELKTPLTNIRLYAEMLEDELELSADEPPARHLRVVIGESQRLSRLIGNILTFARSQRGAKLVHPAPAVLDDVVRDVLLGFAPAFAAKGIDVETVLNAPETREIDADAVLQIVGNLLGNVEKYAAAGRFVRVETSAVDATLRIVVEDRGPGIPTSARERIFQPFERLDDRLTEGATGTGIGLTIARELARQHGGDVVLCERRAASPAASPSGARFEVRISGGSVS